MPQSLQFSDKAIEVLRLMEQRLYTVRQVYGPGSDEHVRMLESLVYSLIAMLRLGGNITAESDTLLYGVSQPMHYGVYFQADRSDPTGSMGEYSVNS